MRTMLDGRIPTKLLLLVLAKWLSAWAEHLREKARAEAAAEPERPTAEVVPFPCPPGSARPAALPPADHELAALEPRPRGAVPWAPRT